MELKSMWRTLCPDLLGTGGRYGNMLKANGCWK
jgi:hypothetical protein